MTGGLMIGIPVFLWGAGVAAGLLGFMIDEGKRLAAARKAMLARMTPQERQAYLLAETATLMAGAEILHHRMRETHKRVSARNTQTVLHGFGPTLAPPAPQHRSRPSLSRVRHLVIPRTVPWTCLLRPAGIGNTSAPGTGLAHRHPAELP